MIKVSVIIPVYNVEKYLKNCLDSVVAQTLKDIEIICVNDGSTDNSLEILEQYAKNDNRIVIINQQNTGQGVARNNAIKIAKGEYLGFVDSDDWIEPDMYEQLYSAAKKNDADLVECSFKCPGSAKEMKKYTKFKHLKKDKKFIFGNIQAPFNKLCKTSFIKSNNISFAPAKFAEDSYFTIRARILAKNTQYLDFYPYNYRITNTSSIHSTNKKDYRNQPFILKESKDFLINHGCYNKLKKYFNDYAMRQLSTAYDCLFDEYKEEFCNNIQKNLDNEIYQMFKKKISPKFARKIFSVENKIQGDGKYKFLTILGIEIKLKRKY